jgi:hypothetical protein
MDDDEFDAIRKQDRRDAAVRALMRLLMPMTTWEAIAGKRCADCGGYATHYFANDPVCCACHGGDMISQEDAKTEHERVLAERGNANVK